MAECSVNESSDSTIEAGSLEMIETIEDKSSRGQTVNSKRKSSEDLKNPNVVKKHKPAETGDWFDDDSLFINVVKNKKPLENGSSMAAEPSNKNNIIEKDKAASISDVILISENEEKTKESNSLDADAKTIASFLGLTELAGIYRKLRKVKTESNRVDLVVNQLLEDDSNDDITEVPQQEIAVPEKKTPIKSKSNDDVMANMLKDIEQVSKILQRKTPKKKKVPTAAYLLLESNQNQTNRVDLVVRQMTAEPSKDVEHVETVNDNDDIVIVEEDERNDKMDDDGASLFNEVEILMKRFPKADANHVFALLECRGGHKNRLHSVSAILWEKHQSTQASEAETTKKDQHEGRVLDESVVANDPLYKDMLKIAKVFPDMDKNELYALCEMYHDKENRVEIVTEEVLRSRRGSQSQEISLDVEYVDKPKAKSLSPNKAQPSDSNSCEKVQTKGESSAAGTSKDISIEPLDQLQLDVKSLMAVVPDCDPDYLYYILEQRFRDPNRIQNLSEELLEQKSYPKLKERIEKDKAKAQIRRIKNMTFNMEEFLVMFPDAPTVFYDETKAVTESYKNHSLVQLKNTFLTMHANYIDEVFNAHKSHFTPALRQLEKEAAEHDPTAPSPRKKKKVPTATLR